jgi:hypothetical protein
MNDFDDLVHALRSEHEGSSERAPATRARIMVSLHEGRHRRRLRWGFGVPVAALLAGSTAWAGARGELGETARTAVTQVGVWLGALEPAAPAAPVAAAPQRAAAPREDAPPPAEAERLQGAEPSATATREPTPAPRFVAATPTPSAAPQAATAPPVPPEPSDPQLLVYREAHEAQFARGNCAEAVRGYDAYLAAAPAGALVPEARFHRAVCLVRLGRGAEARQALAPFAEGAYGKYRQEDARKLLDLLGR